MTRSATRNATRTDRSAPTLLVRRGLALATVLVLAWQFVSAGEFLGPRGDEGFVAGHAAGTIVLHVVAGLALVAALVHRRAHPDAGSTAIVLAALVFVLSFAQAWFGSHGLIALHVPGALVLTVAAVWLAVLGNRELRR